MRCGELQRIRYLRSRRAVARGGRVGLHLDRRQFFGTAAVAWAAAQFRTSHMSAQARDGHAGASAAGNAAARSFAIKQVVAGPLNIGYVDEGPPEGPPVILLHGWPYDIHAFADVVPLLTAHGYRTIVPYLRGYGSTRFTAEARTKNGQQSALAVDVINLLDALKIQRAAVAGFDWGARSADIVAALWPERCSALVSVSGYLIGNQETGQSPLPPRAEYQWWYQYYFATERGAKGYDRYRREFAKLIWHSASPQWNFDDAVFERSAAAFDNPDHVAVVISNYRWRLGLYDGERQYDDLEKRLAVSPTIAVPTITLEGDANGAPHNEPQVYAAKFTGRYEHRNISGGIGHNLPQEAPHAFAQAIRDLGHP
jgi:pimeloyl-ACP methyl ester carboxylesterase